MFIAIGLMLVGMGLGFLLRGRVWLGGLTRCVSPTIMLLLFSLGVAVGGNEALMRDLPELGGTALVLTLAGVAGSLACVALIRRSFAASPGLASPQAAAPTPGQSPDQGQAPAQANSGPHPAETILRPQQHPGDRG